MTDPAGIVFFYRTAHPFSNFHPSRFVVDGVPFRCAEQYIMYRKALYFGDTESARRILAAKDPTACKRLGRGVTPYDDAAWAAVREQVAFDACGYKFRQTPALRDALLDTGSALLVEASPTDAIWGIGFSEADALAHRSEWGLNLLGRALMRVRDGLQRESAATS